MGSIPVGGATNKAGTVQSLPAFFIFPMKTVILSCNKVRDSVPHSGGTRGHFWGQYFRKWGHPPLSAPAARGTFRGTVFHPRHRGFSPLPHPLETCVSEKTGNRSVWLGGLQTFSPPPPIHNPDARRPPFITPQGKGCNLVRPRRAIHPPAARRGSTFALLASFRRDKPGSGPGLSWGVGRSVGAGARRLPR